ncbi:MAG: hypothetical protein ACI898_002186 [Flavobacteriales bacterium]|jgi:hypothetical protein
MFSNAPCKCPPAWRLHPVLARTFFTAEKVGIIRLRLAKLFAIGFRLAAPGSNQLSTLVGKIVQIQVDQLRKPLREVNGIAEGYVPQRNKCMTCAKGGAARSAVSGKLCVRHMLSHGVMRPFSQFYSEF